MNDAASQYAPFVIFMVVTVAFGVMVKSIGGLIRPRRPTAVKGMPYECGNDPVGEANPPILPRYWFYAVLLVLFDVEVVFLVPWALNAAELGAPGFAAVLLFFAVLAAGYLYIWRKGDLDWD